MSPCLEMLVGKETAAMLLEDFGGSLAQLVLREPGAVYSHPGMEMVGAAVELVKAAFREEMAQRDCLGSPQAVKDYLRLALGGKAYEAFFVIFLDCQNRVLAAEEMFHGSVSQATVYPREVVKRALAVNARAVMFAHNHPSGVAEPSGADTRLTITLRQALSVFEVDVLDHFVVAGNGIMSFAERGLI